MALAEKLLSEPFLKSKSRLCYYIDVGGMVIMEERCKNFKMEKIDRLALVQRHNPLLHEIDVTSPLTVGNGEFAFTADVTGMQTFYDYYKDAQMPLCTMAQWGWHTTSFSEERYACDRRELVETEYDFCHRKVYYPIKCAEGNEKVYHWLRQNPHKCNLVRIGLVSLTESGYEEFHIEDISDIEQTLHMELGCLDSRFVLAGQAYRVETYCAGNQDTLAFQAESDALSRGQAGVLISLPYGSPDISGSDWNCPEKHRTEWKEVHDIDTAMGKNTTKISFRHVMDKESYQYEICSEQPIKMTEVSQYTFILQPQKTSPVQARFSFSIYIIPEALAGKNISKKPEPAFPFFRVVQDSEAYWKDFWQKTGVIQLYHSKDKRALELERRIVQSQYLLAVNCCGSMPPQETGLICNSWYGKAHLEMYFWHEAYLPFFGRTDLLERSLDWFMEHLPEARANAAKNGYKGARWTKMVAYDAIDSPSKIAPLLVWQQPHLLYMIYTAYRQTKDKAFLEKYYPIITESAEFMADYAVENEEGFYELVAPLIPVQEKHEPEVTKNPVFEVEYWVLGLRLAAEMSSILGKKIPETWQNVAEHMISAPQENGYYLAHSNAHDTYVNYHRDHPSMLMAYGVIDTGRMDVSAMEKTLELVSQTWDEETLWGWDFAVMAMTAVRLGKPELALELLLKDTYKNKYVASGNNRQISRNDLPLYLPGNGSLLLAMACMTAGYKGCNVDTPGFPKNDMWIVEHEGITPLP